MLATKLKHQKIYKVFIYLTIREDYINKLK